MEFAFFENLTADEAASYQARFLELGAANLPEVVADAKELGIDADLSTASVASVLEGLAGRTTIVPRDPDPSLPDWILSSENYDRYRFDFDEASRIFIMRGAFYLGESFVRTHTSLSWAIGSLDTAVQKQPVVKGFAYSLELAVLLVTENLIAGLVTGDSASEIATVVSWWEAKLGV